MSKWSTTKKVDLVFASDKKEVTIHVDAYLGQLGTRLAQTLCRDLGQGDTVTIGVAKDGSKYVWWLPLLQTMSGECGTYSGSLISFMDQLAEVGVPERGPYKFMVRGAHGEVFTLTSTVFHESTIVDAVTMETTDDLDTSVTSAHVDPVTGLRLSF